MSEVTPDLRAQLQPKQVEKLIATATNPRDKAFIALLARAGWNVVHELFIGCSNIRSSEVYVAFIMFKRLIIIT